MTLGWTALAALGIALGACRDGATQAQPTLCAPPTCRAEAVPLALEVFPPPAAGLPPLEVTDVAFDPETGVFAAAVDAPITLSGRVVVGPGGAAFDGSITATRRSRIPGRPAPSFSASLDGMGRFALPLPPTRAGETYAVRFVPRDPSAYPPWTTTVALDTERTLELALEQGADLPEVRGAVLDAVGQPVRGVQVQALDLSTRQAVSTTALTDQLGSYSLRLSRSFRGGGVILAAAPTHEAPAGLPAIETRVDVATAGAPSTPEVDISVPPLPSPATFVYRLIGRSRAGAEVPIAGAHCKFSTTLADPKNPRTTAVFVAEAESSADGSLTVAIVPADRATREYQLSIAPPATSEFQSAALALSVGPTGGFGQALELARRPQVSGRVLDDAGRPLAHAVVQPNFATLATGTASSSLAQLAKLGTAASNDDGRFVLPLDSGSYDLVIVPPAQTVLPRRWLTSVSVLQDLALGDQRVGVGTVVKAVLTHGGQPLQGATVRLYVVPEQNLACAEAACLTPPHLVGEAVTGPGGAAPLLVPARGD